MNTIEKIRHLIVECADAAVLVYSCKMQVAHLLQRLLTFEIPLQNLTANVYSSLEVDQINSFALLEGIVDDCLLLINHCGQDHFLIECANRSATVRRYNLFFITSFFHFVILFQNVIDSVECP